jgi:hypothetical protein
MSCCVGQASLGVHLVVCALVGVPIKWLCEVHGATIKILFVVSTQFIHDKRVPVTTVWRVLMLQMEERPLIWKVAANILNKQSWTSDKGWSSSLVFRRGASKSPS